MSNRILSNAIWNMVSGMSGAIVSILVPPFLTRELSQEAYGAWALALQIGTYINLFGFGLQIAVGRYVAYAEAREDFTERDGIVATAFWFLISAASVGFLATCILAFSIHQILPDLPSTLTGQTRLAIIFLGFSFAFSLPGTVFAAVFTGLQKSHIPAVIQTVGRVFLAASLILASFWQSLAILGLVYAVISIIIVLFLWISWRKMTKQPTVCFGNAKRQYAKELFSFCISLSIWNISMFVMSGLDLIIVGRWDFNNTSAFAISMTMATFVGSLLTSLSNALVPATAISISNGNISYAQSLLVRSIRINSSISIISGVPLVFFGYYILNIWVGSTYSSSYCILTALSLSGVIRNALLPYVMISIGAGEQRRMLWTPIVEAVFSFSFSMLLVQSHGALGVAFAKIMGAIIGLSLLIGQNALSYIMPTLTRRELLLDGLARPVIVWGLLGSAFWALSKAHLPPIFLAGSISILTFYLIIKLILTSEDRKILLSIIKRNNFLPFYN